MRASFCSPEARGSLFDQLPDIVLQNPDPVVEFCLMTTNFRCS